MSSQVGFFATNEDLVELLAPLDHAGVKAFPLVALLDDTGGGEGAGEFPSIFPKEFVGKKFALLPQSLSRVEIFHTPLEDNSRQGWIDDFNSPVVIVKPCDLEVGSISNGRIFLGNDPSDSRHLDAKKLFKSLSQRIKGWEKTDRFVFFVGPRAAEQVRNGHLKLMHHSTQLQLT